MLRTPRQCPGQAFQSSLPQGSPAARSSTRDFTAVETWTGSLYVPWTLCIDLPSSVQYWLCGGMKVCRRVSLLVVCPRGFNVLLTKHLRYTRTFSWSILSTVSKDKGPSLKFSSGFEGSDFASPVGKQLAPKSLQLWQWERQRVRLSNQSFVQMLGVVA